MTLWEGEKNKKPGRWSLDKGFVAQEWEWFWNDIAGAWVFWEGGGVNIKDLTGHGHDGSPTAPVGVISDTGAAKVIP